MFNPIILAGVFLGWGLGANDSANIFGTAVYTKVVKYRTAVVLTSIFVILGAVLNGNKGIEEVSHYAFESGIITSKSAFFVMFSAALTVAVMTVLKLPVSTSQAVVGAIIGGGILKGTADFSAGTKFFGAWILTPIGGLVFAFILHKIIADIFGKKITNFKYYEVFVKSGYIIAGIFGAYSLGANNVANVMGIFAGQLNIISNFQGVLYGGFAIALGVITFSKPVMSTVGQKIIVLSEIEGFIVVIAASLTVYIYALVGIPVSTSQAVIGAIIGIGIRVGVKTLNIKILRNIMLGWFGTPLVAGVISLVLSMI